MAISSHRDPTARGHRDERTQASSWRALRSLALAHLRHLRVEHPDWTLAQVRSHLRDEETPLIDELALTVGFPDRRDVTANEIAMVQEWIRAGVTDELRIAAETGLSIDLVRLATMAGGYGCAPFGMSPYGGTRRRSDGHEAVPRRITANGQFSYAGGVYSLGKIHRGCVAMIREADRHLEVMVAGASLVRIDKRR